MPTYQYRCTDCGEDLEVVQRFSDAALTTCPRCQGHLRKVFSPVGVVFKGSGFYSTDNHTRGASKAAAGESSSDSSGSSSSDSSGKSSAESASASSASGSTSTSSAAPSATGSSSTTAAS